MMNLRTLCRWNTPDIDALTISLSIYWVLLLPIVCSQRSRVSMYKGLLTHSLLCSKFVELTLNITECYCFFNRSRISVRSFSSLVGSGSGAGAAGSSAFFLESLLIPFTIRNTQKAIIRKSNVVCRKLP